MIDNSWALKSLGWAVLEANYAWGSLTTASYWSPFSFLDQLIVFKCWLASIQVFALLWASLLIAFVIIPLCLYLDLGFLSPTFWNFLTNLVILMCCPFFNQIVISWVMFGVLIDLFRLLIRNCHWCQIIHQIRRAHAWIDGWVKGYLLLWWYCELLNLAWEIGTIVFVKDFGARFHSWLHLHLVLRHIRRNMLLWLLHRVRFLAHRRIQEVKLIAIQPSEIELDLEQPSQDLRREVWELD